MLEGGKGEHGHFIYSIVKFRGGGGGGVGTSNIPFKNKGLWTFDKW